MDANFTEQKNAADLANLCELIACANAKKEKLGKVDVSSFNRIVEHTPEDMTVTVEAGMSVARLQSELRKRGQWLPIDPAKPAELTVGALLAENMSGSRRFGYGTIRDWLIGIRVILADGTLIRSGGKVVKNVAGYDLMKVFVGSHGSLGVIIEATFKLRPLPEVERFAEVRCDSLESADALIQRILDSELSPVVIDLHRSSEDCDPTLVIGFSGTREEVDWQLETAKTFGVHTPATLDYEEQFWSSPTAHNASSVLPSKLVTALQTIRAPWIARAGNGIIYHEGNLATQIENNPSSLMRRLKDTFDPKHIFPEFPSAK